MKIEKALYVVAFWAVCASAAEPLKVTLSFDDGTKDHILFAAPELEKRGWKGVLQHRNRQNRGEGVSDVG